tara:strand:+ start:55 stop:675 length:621 start_codon:yes stop_codon:yes gene_type:complete
MGHTNYYTQVKNFDDLEWNVLIATARQIMYSKASWAEVEVHILDDEETIVVRGKYKLDCEQLTLCKTVTGRSQSGELAAIYNLEAPNVIMSFTKTNKLPYDKYVWVMLMTAKNIAPDKIFIANDDEAVYFDKDVQAAGSYSTFQKLTANKFHNLREAFISKYIRENDVTYVRWNNLFLDADGKPVTIQAIANYDKAVANDWPMNNE